MMERLDMVSRLKSTVFKYEKPEILKQSMLCIHQQMSPGLNAIALCSGNNGMIRLWLLQEKKCKRNLKNGMQGSGWEVIYMWARRVHGDTDYCLAATMPKLHVICQLCEPSIFFQAHPQGMLSFLLVQPLLLTLFHVILTDKSRVGSKGHSVIPHFCLFIAILAGLELLGWFLRSRVF